ncbi:hypothetical protein Tco_0961693 [Tanacetum coccineum]
MFKDNTYKTHEVHNDLYEALQKLVELDHSNQRLADQEEARAFGAPADILKAQELSPTDYLMQDDSIPEEQALLSDDEDSENDHQPKADLRKDWWKPLHEEERPATPKPAWTIPSSNKSDVVNKTVLTQADFEGQAYEVVKAFYLDVIHLQFQMEECHKMLTAQVNWTNPKGDQVRINVNQPLPLGGPPGHVTIQPQFFFNKDLKYLRYGSKGSNPTLSISKIKAASYPNFGLELLVPRQISSILTDMILRRVEKMSEHICGFSVSSESNHTQDTGMTTKAKLSSEELTSKNTRLQKKISRTCYKFTHDYTIIESPRAVVFPVDNNDRKIIRFNEIYKFSDGTLTRILEALDYRVKEFKVNRLNSGMNTRFWTQKDVTRSKEFIAAIERRLKTRRIFRNLECFIGGHVRDIDYRLL